MNRKARRAKSQKGKGPQNKKDIARKWNAQGLQHAVRHELAQALSCFQQAVAHDGNLVDYKLNFGKTALRLGRSAQAFQMFYALVQQDKKNLQYKLLLTHACAGLRVKAFDAEVKQALLLCLQAEGLEHQNLMPLWFQNLQYDKSYKSLLDGDLKTDSYLSLGLRRFFTASPEMEEFIIALRSKVVQALLKEQDETVLPLAVDLALHCFLSEYSFAVPDTDKEYLTASEQQDVPSRLKYVASSLYGSVAPCDESDDVLQPLLQQQVIEPALEAENRKNCPVLGRIEDDVSQDVQNMYEENPYPRWHAVHKPSRQISAPEIRYLIAGCGTGRSSCQTALTLPETKITAIDLSLTSLGYAMRKAEEIGLNTLDFAQSDILGLSKTENQFDIIECSGVLHHMADPVAGWKALIDVLAKGGCMNIGLYSRKARDVIIKAQDYAQKNKYKDDTDGIRQFRKDILALPEDHELSELRRRQDFYTLSGCRDLVFHVQEKCYDLKDITKMLKVLGLKILSLVPATPAIASLYRKTYPSDPQMAELKNWEKLEQQYPQICVGMYQFWCMRKDEQISDNTQVEKLAQQHFFTL